MNIRTGMLFTITTWTVLQFIIHAESLAIFETHVVAFSNPTNRNELGQCCQAAQPVSSACRLDCQTCFEVCLDDLHLEEPNCMFGRNKSRTFRTSNLPANGTSLDRSIRISTLLSWPGTFGLRITAFDNSTSTMASKGVIQSVVFVDKITPGYGWKTKNDSGPVSSFVYKYRVVCAPNYYGLNCTVFCNPRNDSHGHYGCDVNGRKYCLDGWSGNSSYCTTPICIQTCQHGSCSGPNICSCNRGWTGSSCSTCQTRIGCVHGTCRIPGGCNCKTGWGGPNCDKEMDYCGMHKPCQNGGTCINNGLGAFLCYCRADFLGKRCETAKTACTSNPCQNGGTCQVVGSGYKCNCAHEYTGAQCETWFDPCASFQCQNNGTCIAIGRYSSCTCLAGFTGQRCESTIRASTSQVATQASTQGSSQAMIVHSISPDNSLSRSYASIRVSALLESNHSEATISSLKSSIASSYDISQRRTSTNSYQTSSTFTHTKSTQSYTVYIHDSRHIALHTSTQGSSQAMIVHSISPANSLSHSYASIRVTTLLESYHSEATTSSFKSGIASSYDISQRRISTNSYQTASTFTQTKSTQSYTVYSQEFSSLSPSFIRPSSSWYQATQGGMSFTVPLPAAPSQSAMLSTVSLENYFTSAASRFSTESRLSTRSIPIDGDQTTLYKSVVVSPTINKESKSILPTVNGEGDRSVILTTRAARFLPSSISPPATSQVLSISIATSKVPNSHNRKTQYRGSSKRSMAIGISVSISFVIILIITFIILWTKFSKRRGKHKFRTSSTIVPDSMNNPCKLLDTFSPSNKSLAATNIGHYSTFQGEKSSSISDRSQAVSSKDINIDSSYLQLHSNGDPKGGYLNTCNSFMTFGYLSEGTSGYESENSSSRSSANFNTQGSKSPLNTDDIVVSKCSASNGPSGNLPNFVIYGEEHREVEL